MNIYGKHMDIHEYPSETHAKQMKRENNGQKQRKKRKKTVKNK
jgi:hypothetical protein